ncbi:MAG: hypothetical protein NT049_09605 [Planctomycetota bacterium]|nr:hypothetical protein [Planctomycetota bacterium]
MKRRSLPHLLIPVVAILLASPVAAGENLVPFPVDWTVKADSLVDLTRLLDAPAGQHGPVKAIDGHLVRGDGKRLRLWGVNVVSASAFPDKEQAPLIAADLARLGFNFVRFHHIDGRWTSLFPAKADNTRAFDPENLDRLDFLFAELKKRGIWATFTMNTSRVYREGDGAGDYKILSYAKGATYFNPRLIELQHEFTRNFLTHKNPYTGNEYRREPAVVSIEMVNENSLVEAWINKRLDGTSQEFEGTWAPLPPSYCQELTEQYNRWLAANRKADEIAAIRKEAGVGPEALIPRLTPAQFAAASRPRFAAEAEFLMSVEAAYFAGMKRLIRDELGAVQLLVGTADHNDRYPAYAHVASMLQLDLIHGNGYWEHPERGKYIKIKNTPMVNDPLDCPFTQFARTPVAGKPFVISETNHPWPHKFAAEGYATLAAYALLQDWDGITWFDWGAGRLAKPGAGIGGSFSLSQDPVKLAHLAAAALMWHRRDVAAARQTVVRAYTHDTMIDALRMARKESPFFTPDFARSTPLVNRTCWTLDGQPSPFPPPAPMADIASETGEMHWRHADQKRGVLAITSPCSQALVGFVRGSGDSTAHLAADVTNEFCSIVLVALDDRPIAKSAKLLLVATTGAAANTGQKFDEDGKTLLEQGKGPVLIEPVAGTVTLRGLDEARAVTAQPMDGVGRAIGSPIAATKSDAGWTLRLGEPPTTWYVIQAAR